MTTEVLNIKTVQDYAILENQVNMITDIQSRLEKGRNLADIIWDMEASEHITKRQIPAIVHTLLIEKHQYASLSFNLSTTMADWRNIYQVVKAWDQFDTVIAYYHPQLDVSLINPSNQEHWERIESLSVYELIVIFTKAKDPSLRDKEAKFLTDFKAICSGRFAEHEKDYSSDETATEPVKAETKPVATDKTEAEHKPGEEPPASIEEKPESKKKKRITPKYGVQVSNELFHNGNVEAWRNIIESYEKKYPGSTILLFHNGQRIKHISSLFKWGKVKTGDSIFFSIVGEEIKDVAKLKKYLYQGASESFKYFIKKDVNVVINLF